MTYGPPCTFDQNWIFCTTSQNYSSNHWHMKLLLLYEGSPITISKSAKYLRVYIDDYLNFKIHVKLLYAKLSRSLGILYKVKYYLPKKSLLHLYIVLIHSHLLNCVTIWFSTYQTYTTPISKLQDRAIKLILW